MPHAFKHIIHLDVSLVFKAATSVHTESLFSVWELPYGEEGLLFSMSCLPHVSKIANYQSTTKYLSWQITETKATVE